MATPTDPVGRLMAETKQADNRVFWSIVVVGVPWLLLLLIGALGGGFAVGTPELLLLATIWVVGLAVVWRPRRG
jgi:hypothetical protein